MKGSVSLEQLEREKRIVEALYRVGDAVAREHDLQEIVQLVTDEATLLTEAQFGAFFYNQIDARGESYLLFTISGVPRSAFENFPMPRNSEIFRPTFEGSAVVRIDDVTQDPRFGRNAPYYGMPPGHLPVRSYLAAPVFEDDGTVAGGLFFGSEEIGVFTEEHERIVTGIATQAGLAITRVRLLEAERRARAEAEARATAARSLDHVGDGIVMVDGEGVIRLWNRGAERITGIAAADAVGRKIGVAVPGWEKIALRVPVGDAREPGRPRTLPLDVPGRERWLSLYGVDFGDGTVYSFRDVTAERHLEDLRSDLIATVSHEIRTPVAAVYGAARTLMRDGLAEDVTARLLEILSNESERLATLVGEILLAGSIDSDRIAVARVEMDLAQVVRDAVASEVVARGEQRFAVEAPEQALAMADPERVGQVVANLLENATKYGTPPVAVRVTERHGSVRVEVNDAGPGIPLEEQERIFEKFYRLDPQMESGVRGSGLGLYICRELVSRMQGTMGVRSEPGRGSSFWFELPRPWTSEPAGGS